MSERTDHCCHFEYQGGQTVAGLHLDWSSRRIEGVRILSSISKLSVQRSKYEPPMRPLALGVRSPSWVVWVFVICLRGELTSRVARAASAGDER
jgi:hypothetical protein